MVTRAQAAKLFRDRLREARKLQGFTQEDVGKGALMSRRAVQHFESGERRPSLENLRRLCLALHVSADWLLGLKEVDPR